MEHRLVFNDGSALPVGTVFCIGRNYAAHAREMGAEVPEAPLVFIKPATAVVQTGSTVQRPAYSELMHHEVELVVAIGKDCIAASRHNAHDYIAGVGIGIDFTLRDVQEIAKRKGEPWALSKGFPGAAPVSTFVPLSDSRIGSHTVFDLRLAVNGLIRQSGTTLHMERSIEHLIEYLSATFTLRRGDIIFTGTPEGVGAVTKGDQLVASLHAGAETLASLECSIAFSSIQ